MHEVRTCDCHSVNSSSQSRCLQVQITSNNTALITAYQVIPYDLSPVNGSVSGHLLNVYAQEIDIENSPRISFASSSFIAHCILTDKAIFTWSAIDHVNITQSHQPLGDTGTLAKPYDFFVRLTRNFSVRDLLIDFTL